MNARYGPSATPSILLRRPSRWRINSGSTLVAFDEGGVGHSNRRDCCRPLNPATLKGHFLRSLAEFLVRLSHAMIRQAKKAKIELEFFFERTVGDHPRGDPISSPAAPPALGAAPGWVATSFAKSAPQYTHAVRAALLMRAH